MSHTTLRLLRSASTFSTPLLRHKSTVAQIASTLKDVGSVITKPIARMQHQNVSSASKEVSAPLTATDRKVAQLTQQQKLAACSDADILNMIDSGKLRMFALEQDLGDMERAVRIRRSIIENKTNFDMSNLPYENYNYRQVYGQCCENVIGIVPIPVGVAGPLLIDGKEYHVPMATTEGALVASTTRGCKAITMSGGTHTEVVQDGMSRAPVLSARNVKEAAAVKRFVDANFDRFAEIFNATSRFARLVDIKTILAGRKIYIRFKCTTGDAMGMNMVGKGVEKALNVLLAEFPEVELLALSGNVCTDKKPSAINWIEGRGKSVVCDATIPGHIVESLLKTSVAAMVELNYAKNHLGSAVAGSIGGLNAHASNVVTSIFLATGQDPAQNVESSNCITQMESVNGGKDLYVSITMPSLEVGTVGGGTNLPGQQSMLGLIGVAGSNPDKPGDNAKQLARVIASTVMAGELSLMAALSSGHLISSHMKLNRAGQPATPSPMTTR